MLGERTNRKSYGMGILRATARECWHGLGLALGAGLPAQAPCRCRPNVQAIRCNIVYFVLENPTEHNTVHNDSF